MHGQSFHTNANARVPYSHWAQHRAPNGLIYLSHPVTGEVKWLWSRHHDPKTSSDYLVNTITGDRQWVTKQNAHLCPTRPQSDSVASTQPQPSTSSTSTNPFSNTPKSSPNTHVPSVRQPAKPHAASYREIEAPKSLGLTADEVLMFVPGTGRKYIYNRKTKSSRWLPDRVSDKIGIDPQSKDFPAERKIPPKPSLSPFESDGDQPAPQSRQRTSASGLAHDHNPVSSTSSASAASQSRPPEMMPSQSSSMRSPSSQTPTQQNSYAANAYSQRRTQPIRSHPAPNGNSTLPKVTYGSEEAAEIIQRLFRGAVVRRADIVGKLQLLSGVVENVCLMTSGGRYDLTELRRLTGRRARMEEKQDGEKRLLELGEYLTQQMLKMDAVESGGNQLVRTKRKQSVKLILGLSEEVDGLRKALRNM